MAHTQFDFYEVPDGDDVIAKCRECDYEVMFIYEKKRVQPLNFGDTSIPHSVTRIPPDGLVLSVGLGGSKDKPPGGDEPFTPILPLRPRGATDEASRRAGDTCAHGKPGGT